MKPLARLLPLALWALGCSGPSQEAPTMTLERASEEVSFGTISSLGPHRLETSVIRRVLPASGAAEPLSETDEQIILAWQDWDNFQYQRLRDGTLVTDNLVVKGNFWERGPSGRKVRGGDPEPVRADLRLAWDVWGASLAPFLDDLVYERVEEGIIEGRAARRFKLDLKPAPTPSRSGLRPVSLSGHVWLDQATAVRLLAEVQGRWARSGDEGHVQEVVLYLVRSRIGEPQALRAPGVERRKSRRQGQPASPEAVPTGGPDPAIQPGTGG